MTHQDIEIQELRRIVEEQQARLDQLVRRVATMRELVSVHLGELETFMESINATGVRITSTSEVKPAEKSSVAHRSVERESVAPPPDTL